MRTKPVSNQHCRRFKPMLCHWSYSSICLPRILTDHCFLIVEFIRQQTRAESKGFEPLYCLTDSLGLANLHITALSTLHLLLRPTADRNDCAERGNRTPDPLWADYCFQDSFLDHPDSFHSVGDRANGGTGKPNPPSFAHSQ
jgi:hypothetical protein